MATKKDGEKSRTHTLSIFLMKTTHSAVKAALKQRAGLKQQSLSLTGATTAELWTRSTLPPHDLPESGETSAP